MKRNYESLQQHAAKESADFVALKKWKDEHENLQHKMTSARSKEQNEL